MKRVLCLVSAMNAGGAETFLMKIYRCLDKTQYQMDFCVNVKEEGLYDAEIQSMGGKIYHIPSKSENVREFAWQLFQIVEDNGYENVMRVTSNAMGFYDLAIAKKAGAVNCIARSSNSSDGGGLKPWIAHRVGKVLYKSAVDVEIAPSDLAAIYTFGKKDYRSGKVKILHNGIDFKEYAFSTEARQRIRKELGIRDDCFVIGHIGRFSEQKNHTYLIERFAEVHKEHPDTVLLLVGDGKLQESIQQKCGDLNIENAVIFAGIRSDVPAVLSAMDLFVFPSLYEGMPNVIIEAQAAGLRCLVSDTITKEVILTDLVQQIPLEKLEQWKAAICDAIQTTREKTDERFETQLPKDYDIHEVAEEFVSYLV